MFSSYFEGDPFQVFAKRDESVAVALSLLQRVATDVDSNPVQPREEILILTEPFEVLVNPQKNFLRRVAGVRLITQHPPGHCHHSLLRMNHDLFKGRRVASRGSLNEESQR